VVVTRDKGKAGRHNFSGFKRSAGSNRASARAAFERARLFQRSNISGLEAGQAGAHAVCAQNATSRAYESNPSLPDACPTEKSNACKKIDCADCLFAGCGRRMVACEHSRLCADSHRRGRIAISGMRRAARRVLGNFVYACISLIADGIRAPPPFPTDSALLRSFFLRYAI